jgi:hypothetical protein
MQDFKNLKKKTAGFFIIKKGEDFTSMENLGKCIK